MRPKDRNTSSKHFANKVSEYGDNYGIFEISFEMRRKKIVGGRREERKAARSRIGEETGEIGIDKYWIEKKGDFSQKMRIQFIE